MIVNLSHIEHLQRLQNGQLQVRLRGATGEFRVSLRMAGRFGREISQLHSPAACQ
jgi:DNA-binding LytR/AlgR family response regulator